MDPNGFQWNPMILSVSKYPQLLPIKPNGAQGIQMNPYEQKLTSMDPSVSQLIPMDPNGA